MHTLWLNYSTNVLEKKIATQKFSRSFKIQKWFFCVLLAGSDDFENIEPLIETNSITKT